MNEKLLNKLNSGEKLVKVEEYSQDGCDYCKVIIYTCTGKILWLRRIIDKEIPFYFASKDLAINFLKYYDNFDWEIVDACENSKWLETYQLKLLNYTNRHEYYMVDVSGDKHLLYHGIWGGIVNTNGRHEIKSINNMNYKDIFDQEEKLHDSDPKFCGEYVFKMMKE